MEEVLEVESGKRNDRPALAAALKLCRKHKATLVIAKLDRLARNVAFISNLMESGVEFVAVDMPQANRFVVHILAAVAEQEAEAISKRTKAALAAAKARGTKLGGRRVSAERFAEIGAVARQVRSQIVSQVRSELLPTITAIQASGAISLRAISAELNAPEIPTPRRAGEWSAVQVQNDRYAAETSLAMVGRQTQATILTSLLQGGANPWRSCTFSLRLLPFPWWYSHVVRGWHKN
ncbi:DNA invertase Pin-like site-specific DNA recombinase [Granulicella aggregans]|uniref:DNA invertase Pin-like site-specific DNA recombinase n=1 Tax=Granulicella aggregans TaxID=474949 RepID=A0A7W8E6R3_9BACT|nr:DNA invertase Pin-like site-specific DNA recombinase [Granulicella aggregans]